MIGDEVSGSIQLQRKVLQGFEFFQSSKVHLGCVDRGWSGEDFAADE